jgi:hypothetical protein
MKGDCFIMSDEFTSTDKEQDQSGPQTWEASFGRNRFRAQWKREPGRVWFQFQGPFTEEDDPDGVGTPFTPDFGIEWERGKVPHTYGEYDERLDQIREKAEKTARRTAERARDYAERASKQMRDRNWDAMEQDVRSAMDKALVELEKTLKRLRTEWEKRQEEAQSGAQKGPQAQRVPVEYEVTEETPSENADAMNSPSTSRYTNPERDALRRTILEELGAGIITLDEAEQRLRDLMNIRKPISLATDSPLSPTIRTVSLRFIWYSMREVSERRYNQWLKTTSRSQRSIPPGRRTRITSKRPLRHSPPNSLSCAPRLTCAPSAKMRCTSSVAVRAGSSISCARTVGRR